MGGNSSLYTIRPGNYFPANWAAVGFTDQANGNYKLAPSSIYRNVATDGTDLGANIDVLNGNTYGAISGNWPFAYMSGPTLFVHFDGAGTPISLATSGSNITATKGATVLSFSGVTGISAFDPTADDRLQINTAVAAPLTYGISGGNDQVEVNSGSYTFATDLAGTSTSRSLLPLQKPAVLVAAGASASFNASQHLRNLTVTGAAILTAGGNKIIVT